MNDDDLAKLLRRSGRIPMDALDGLLAERTRIARGGGEPPPLEQALFDRGLLSPETLKELLNHDAFGGQISDELREEVRKARSDPAKHLGKFLLLGELGRGGMGVVYRAWQTDLQRVVALKVMEHPGAPELVARFLREARLSSRLRHPNIVSVFEFGETTGRAWFAMDLIDGKPFDQIVHPKRPPVRKIVEHIRTVARALHYAHGLGIIHRDIKPQNILVAADGRPVLTDFGLARDVSSESRLTLSGAFVGTPAFMSPEQARGDREAIGVASDIYSLGSTLYDALTGVPPLTADSLFEMMKVLEEQDPVPPSSRVSGISKDLDAVVMKCLAKSPSARYATAEALAADLDRYLEKGTVEAKPEGAISKFVRRVRRRPIAAVAVAASVVIAGLVALLLASGGDRPSPQAFALENRVEKMLRARDFPGAARALDEFVPAAAADKPFVERLRGRLRKESEAAFQELDLRARGLAARDRFDEALAVYAEARRWAWKELEERIGKGEADVGRARQAFETAAESELQKLFAADEGNDVQKCRSLLYSWKRFAASAAWTKAVARIEAISAKVAEPAPDVKGFSVVPRRAGELLYWNYDFAQNRQFADWAATPLDTPTSLGFGMRPDDGMYVRNARVYFAAPIAGDARLSVTLRIAELGQPFLGIGLGGYTVIVNRQFVVVGAPSGDEFAGHTLSIPKEGDSIRVTLRLVGGKITAQFGEEEILQKTLPEPAMPIRPWVQTLMNTAVVCRDVLIGGTLREGWTEAAETDRKLRDGVGARYPLSAPVDLLSGGVYGRLRKEEEGAWTREEGGLRGVAGPGQRAELHGDDPVHSRLRLEYRFHSGNRFEIRVRAGLRMLRYRLPADRPEAWRKVEILCLPGEADCRVDGVIPILPFESLARASDEPFLRIKTEESSASIRAVTLEEIRGLSADRPWQLLFDDGRVGKIQIGPGWKNVGALEGSGEIRSTQSWADFEAEIGLDVRPQAKLVLGVRGRDAVVEPPMPAAGVVHIRLRAVGTTLTVESERFYYRKEIPTEPGPLYLRAPGERMLAVNGIRVREVK